MVKTFLPKVRVTAEEKNTYSIDNPNPEWKIKGEKWMELASRDKIGGYAVAYIPHITTTIIQDGKAHDVIPTYWEPEERVNSVDYHRYNFDLGPFGVFRLNARLKSKDDPFLRSRMNIDLDPKKDGDKEIIFGLLKLAEKIFEPERFIICDKKSRKEYVERITKQLESMKDQ